MQHEATSSQPPSDALCSYLEMVQGVITRMGQNSFNAKTWSVTLMGAVLAFADTASSFGVWLAIVPAMAFWLLDVFYLRQERLYRALYNAAVEGRVPLFSMDTKPFEEAVDGVGQDIAYSHSVALVHLVAMIGIALKAARIQGWLGA